MAKRTELDLSKMLPSHGSAISARFKDAQSKLVIQTADLPLGTLADMVETGTIDLGPSFQRRERWSREKQSALIESFILNVPVPPIYLAEEDYGKYTAIDGKQRLSSITSYIYSRFRLKGLTGFEEIENFLFSELPVEIKNALKIRPFLRVVTLLKQSDPNLKYEVFTRLNRGGEALNAQELRNVAFRGPLNDAIYEIAASSTFLLSRLKIRGNQSPAYKEMVDAEFVLRYFALEAARGDYSGSLLKTMDAFMVKFHNDAGEIQKARTSFETALSRCEAIWGTVAFRRPEGSTWRDQTLAGMYDAQMLATSALTQSEADRAIEARETILKRTQTLFNDAEFDSSVRQATNTPSRITYRVNKVLDMLKSV